jgi:hypothetical protein
VDSGIEFEEYDTEKFKTVNHIVTSKGIGALCLVQGSRRQHHPPVSARVTTSQTAKSEPMKRCQQRRAMAGNPVGTPKPGEAETVHLVA